MRCRLGLNQSRRDNFVFFDPDAPLHLSLSNPVGYTSRVTNSIVTAIKVGKVIDIDNAIDLENRCFRVIEQPTQAPLVNPDDAMLINQTQAPSDVIEEQEVVNLPQEEVPVNIPQEEVAPQDTSKKGKKDKANETAEK